MISKFKFFVNILLGIFLLSVLPACNTNKKGTSSLKTRSAKFLNKKLNNQKLDADWYSSKAKISYRDNQQSLKIASTIRMRKDSVIWMNVKKLGVEAARIQITKDSIYIINRLDKNYIITDFKYLEDRYGLPANFTTLQNLLLGNPVVLTMDNRKSSIDDMTYQLSAHNDQIMNTFWLNSATFLLEQMNIEEKEQKRELLVQQSDYKEIGAVGFFPHSRLFQVESRETGALSIEIAFSRIEINTAKSIKFSIPDHYERYQ